MKKILPLLIALILISSVYAFSYPSNTYGDAPSTRGIEPWWEDRISWWSWDDKDGRGNNWMEPDSMWVTLICSSEVAGGGGYDKINGRNYAVDLKGRLSDEGVEATVANFNGGWYGVGNIFARFTNFSESDFDLNQSIGRYDIEFSINPPDNSRVYYSLYTYYMHNGKKEYILFYNPSVDEPEEDDLLWVAHTEKPIKKRLAFDLDLNQPKNVWHPEIYLDTYVVKAGKTGPINVKDNRSKTKDLSEMDGFSEELNQAKAVFIGGDETKTMDPFVISSASATGYSIAGS
jgi:hypothetical protein